MIGRSKVALHASPSRPALENRMATPKSGRITGKPSMAVIPGLFPVLEAMAAIMVMMEAKPLQPSNKAVAIMRGALSA